MEILFVLIPLGLLLLIGAIWAFYWAIKNDQYDDLDSPAYRILFDDEDQPVQDASNSSPPAQDAQEQCNQHDKLR